MNTLVDIVIPSYNRKAFLKRAILSVQNQTFKNWNLWVVDDGSTDETANMVCTFFAGDPRVKIISLKSNQGVSRARNTGTRQGKGEWVAFLDSDDEWTPEKLEKQMKFAINNPNFPLIHCNEIWIKDGKILHQKKHHKKQGGRIFLSSVRLCCISPSSVVLKRSLLREVGGFREDFPVCEDYEMWLRVTSRYSVGFVQSALVVKYGGHADQLSRRYPAMDYWRIKALKNYIMDKSLSQEEREVVQATLQEKARILLQGYNKYKNLKNKKEVESILDSSLKKG